MSAKRATAVGTEEQGEAQTTEPLTITIAQAARRIGVSRTILVPYVMAGRLPSIVLGSRERRVIAAHIPAFLNDLWQEQRYQLAS